MIIEIQFNLVHNRAIETDGLPMRTLKFSVNNTLEEVSELIAVVFEFEELHAYSFHFDAPPFTSTDGEYGSPQHKIRNPVEGTHRAISLLRNTKDHDNEDFQKFMQSFVGTSSIDDVEPIADGASVTISDIDLQVGDNFYFVYDWGDMITFTSKVVGLEDGDMAKRKVKITNAEGDLEDIYEEQEIGFENEAEQLDIVTQEDSIEWKRDTWILPNEKGFDKKQSENDIRAYRTPYSGSLILTISIPYNKTYDNLEFLIDLQKAGVKDVIHIRSQRDKIIQRIWDRGQEIVRIPTSEALFTLVRGYRMAKAVEYPIRKETMKWLKKLGVTKRKIKGSPFRCFDCERGELKDEEVEYIKSVAKEDIRKRTVGTPNENIIYFVCGQC